MHMSHVDQAQPDTRSRIIEEAERLFRVYGYSKTTVADIAKACRMSPANVYRFFASKAAINEAICELWLGQLEALVAGIARRDGPAPERLRRVLIEGHDYSRARFLGDSKVHEMVTAAMDEHWGVISAHVQRVMEWVARIIADGVARGEFRMVDPAAAARCVHAASVSLFHPQLLAECMQRSPETFASAEELADFILGALEP